jgi:ribosome recycling factor
MDLVSEFKIKSQNIINSLKENLKSIRTGRANPSLVENLIVETYGGQTKLRLLELATITIEGPQAISILPFDPSVQLDIEKAILKSPLGLSPTVQGNRLIIKIPSLSQEQRNKYIKIVGETIEVKKNQVRSIRDDVRKKIKSNFENKETTEDEKFRLEKEIDNLTSQIMEEIQTIRANKEQEIREL